LEIIQYCFLNQFMPVAQKLSEQKQKPATTEEPRTWRQDIVLITHTHETSEFRATHTHTRQCIGGQAHTQTQKTHCTLIRSRAPSIALVMFAMLLVNYRKTACIPQ
jgi:hypothetical protein